MTVKLPLPDHHLLHAFHLDPARANSISNELYRVNEHNVKTQTSQTTSVACILIASF